MKAAMGNTMEVKALQQLQLSRSSDRNRKLLESFWTICTCACVAPGGVPL